MAYIINQDFRIGVDRRRSRIAGAPGTLWTCINAHITRGGEIEKRKKFVEKWSVPATTFGVKVIDGTGYVFGSDATAAVPSGVTYQRLASPSTDMPSMTALLDVKSFDGLIYAVAQFSDDTISHFLNGERVTAWDAGVVQGWHTALDTVAAGIAAEINANGSEVATASAAGAVITITGKTVDVALNIAAEAINGGAIDDETAAVTITQADDATHVEITTVTLGGTLDTGDRFAVTIGDNEYGAGGNPATTATRIIVHRSKVYAIAGPLIYFSAVDNALVWRPDVTLTPGAGQINASTRSEGNLNLIGLGDYQGGLAFFSDNSAQTWNLDEDPANNALLQTLPNTGAIAADSIATYGGNDTFYLSRSGVRSLRTRDSSGAPFVNDVGNSIDSLVIEHMRTLTAEQIGAAKSTIDPVDGRYWLAVDQRIYVLSHFPGAKITAWSWYEPGFTVDAFSTDSGKIYVRSGTSIYVYGGDDGTSYDEDADDLYSVEVSMPYMATTKIAHDKVVTAYDLAVTGTWLCELLIDPRNENRKVVLGEISESTYPAAIHPASAGGTHFAPVMTCNTPGAATIANMALHLEEDELETAR